MQERESRKELVVDASHLETLIQALAARGYTVVGPRLRDGAIVYETISSAQDLPAGYVDRQEKATYRLEKKDGAGYFSYTVGPQAWKKFLHPPELKLFQANRNGKTFEIVPLRENVPKYAFLGVRSCELHAIHIQDRVFMAGSYVDTHYQRRREQAFIVAVNCTRAGGTCFCVSMNTGPRADGGYDLALTEIIESGRHDFLVEIGSERGEAIMQQIPGRPASEADLLQAQQRIAAAERQMGRHLDTTGLKDLFYQNYEHPNWAEVAGRCLSCANCTMVCPTCFCTTVEDVTDLTGTVAERWRRWDSCFTMDFSYIHGGSVRATPASRYRQWITHKLASWQDQFGTSGCVGCGRCITWCPVGIDITEEAAALRNSAAKNHQKTETGV